jgi:hypothetical protein
MDFSTQSNRVIRKFELIGLLAWRWLRQRDWLAAGAFTLPLSLYLLTLAPTIYNLDSAELTTAVASHGIMRATGYPLYLFLGRIWISLVPIGDMGFRMNLFSAVWGATTILLAEYILRHLGVNKWARIGALGLLTAVPYFWAMSLVAEVYTLHTALMAAIILTLLRWGESPSPQRLVWPVFLLALSMGNHVAAVLLVPGCVWYVLVQSPRVVIRPSTWLVVTLGIIAGAAIFFYLPWQYSQNPVFNYAGEFDASGTFHPVNLMTIDGVLWLITGRTFAEQIFGYKLTELWPEITKYGVQLWQSFFVIGVGPGLLGTAIAWRRNWRMAGLLTLMFLANAIFYINYHVVDKNTMFLPTYLIWAIWLGLGYHTLLQWLRPNKTGGNPHRLNLTRVTTFIMLTAVMLAISWNWSLVDRSDDWSTREQSEEILRLVEPNAMIFGWWETIPGVQYLQFVEGQRPDVLAINRFLISGEDMTALIEREAGHRPIYVNNPPLYFLQTMDIKEVGPLYQLRP